jgi:hypothetical protein
MVSVQPSARVECVFWLSNTLDRHQTKPRHLLNRLIWSPLFIRAADTNTPEQNLASPMMSQPKFPQFANVVDGVQLAQNISASYSAEEQDTFEKITSSELDSYQRFVKIAELKPGETILDLACGPGLTGPLVCEHLGKEGALNVTFADASILFLEKAKRWVNSRSNLLDSIA